MLAKLTTCAAILFAMAGSAMAGDAVTLRLEWAIGGGHGPFFLAKERGYFTAEGIDIEISPGNGSSKTVAIVGSGGATFGISDGASLIRNAAQGLPIKMVGVIANTSPFSLTVREDSGIKTIKDIEGRKIAFTAGTAQASVFPAVMQLNGVDSSKVSLVNLDSSGALAAMAQKQVDGQLTGIDGTPIVLAARGVLTKSFLFNDLGVVAVGKGIVASEKTIAENPDLIRRFLKAVKRGFEAAKADPSAAAHAAHEAQDPAARQDEGQLKQLMEINLSLIDSPNTKGAPFLTTSEKDWQAQLDTLKKYGDLKTDRNPSSFFTNEFVPQ